MICFCAVDGNARNVIAIYVSENNHASINGYRQTDKKDTNPSIVDISLTTPFSTRNKKDSTLATLNSRC